MAMASWMLRSRNLRSGKYKSRQENEEDAVRLDFEKDAHVNAREILSELSRTEGISDGKRLNYLNSFVKLTLRLSGNFDALGYTTEEILYCLRFSLVNESTQVRSGAFRAIRHVVSNENDVIYFNKLLIPYMVVRSLDLAIKDDIERVEAMKLIRKILLISPRHFDVSLSRCLVSLANGGVEEKDRMLRVCLAALSELGVLNSDMFIASGGVTAITRNLLECQTPKIAESLCGVLLLLLDKPSTRNQAAIDIHCVAAPYCDFHYRHGWMDKNRDERELRFNCSRLALLTILRSWPGILHFCSPNDTSGLKAIVDVLYLNQLEVRKAVLDLLYELLNLPQPEWTDELSVALSAVNPAEPLGSWRLSEGFVVAEGRSVLPHLARVTPNIRDMHLSVLLYCFLETGLLGALAEVIATSDTFISVRATVLLGVLLRLIEVLLPPECCDISPALPNLLEYATRNRPQALRAVTALQQLQRLLIHGLSSNSLYLDFIVRSGNLVKFSEKKEQMRKVKSGHSRNKLSQFVMKEGDDVLKDTGVLSNKDAFTWNWNLIKIILRGEKDFNLDLTETNHRAFLKRLVVFYMPSYNRYSHMDLTSPKNTHGYTIVGIELIQCLVRIEDGFCIKLLIELFEDILLHIRYIKSAKSAHDCLFSPQHMMNTQCQSYFLFIGRFNTSPLGHKILNNLKVLEELTHLATTTNHDCYVKLIVSSMDYEHKGSKELLAAVLTCPNETSRLYATQFLLVLLRAGLPHFSSWGIEYLAKQLHDSSRAVYLSALSTLHEACEVTEYLEHLVKINPDVLHLRLGEKGVFLLIRFMSVPNGFKMLHKANFVINELRRWDEYYNSRYVFFMDGETADSLTLHQRGEDGRYDKRTSLLRSTNHKDLFLAPHIYGQLAKTPEGYDILLNHGSLDNFITNMESGPCETDEQILQMKAALWAVGHFGSCAKGCDYLISSNALSLMVTLATRCVVYSIRATAFYALGLIATTKIGADALFKLGWVCTRHDRHDRWPIIEEENWESDTESSSTSTIPAGSESDKSDLAFCNLEYIPDADTATAVEDDTLYFGESGYQEKSSLPENLSTIVLHHKRSLSESKTFEYLKSDKKYKNQTRLSADAPHRYRDNSVTESTTSGVSSCESVLGKSVISDRTQTLSPIPSSSSLMTIKTTGVIIRRHSESSRKGAIQSLTPDKTISPSGSTTGRLSHQDLIGITKVRSYRWQTKNLEELSDEVFENNPFLRVHSLDRQRKQRSSYNDNETDIFTNLLMGGLSLTSLSSAKKVPLASPKRKEQSYMGIALPLALTDMFPDHQAVSHRISFNADKNLADSDTDTESELSTSTGASSHKNNRFAKHTVRTCFSCSYAVNRAKKYNAGKGESMPSDGSQPDSTEIITLKRNILVQVESLANPLAVKHAKHMLLNMKQRNPAIFQDICLYSEVCKMLSECSFRLVPRRFLQDIFFDINLDVFSRDLGLIFATERNVPMGLVTSAEIKSSKGSYTCDAKEQRKTELCSGSSSSSGGKKVQKGVGGGGSVTEEVERFSPTRFEPRSPPLSSVTEENVASNENLLNENTNVPKQNSITNKTDSKTLISTIRTLDQLKLTYNENKFPIKPRDDKDVIK